MLKPFRTVPAVIAVSSLPQPLRRPRAPGLRSTASSHVGHMGPGRDVERRGVDVVLARCEGPRAGDQGQPHVALARVTRGKWQASGEDDYPIVLLNATDGVGSRHNWSVGLNGAHTGCGSKARILVKDDFGVYFCGFRSRR